MPKADRGPSRPLALRCPRCGYDLSGSPAARDHPNTPASDACTICPECGLKSLWADIRDPSRNKIRWLFEHTPRRRLGLARAWRTLFRTVLPWRFWEAVTLASRLSTTRLLLWLPVLIIPLHLLWASLNTARRIVDATAGGTPLSLIPAPEWTNILLGSWGYPLIVRGWSRAGWTWRLAPPEASFLMPLGATLLAPLILLVLTRSRATSKIRPGHILRAGIYGSGWIVGWYVLAISMTFAAAIGEWVFGLRGARFFNFALAGPGRTTIPLSPIVAPVALCLLWYALWWRYSITRFMRLDRPQLVFWLVLLASLLLGVNLALLDPEFSSWAVGRLWRMGF